MGSNGILIKKNQGILKFHLGWDHHASQTRMLAQQWEYNEPKRAESP
jgi:hypothetical protein